MKLTTHLHFYSVSIHAHYAIKIHFNIILLSMSRSSTKTISFTSFDQNLYTHLLPYMRSAHLIPVALIIPVIFCGEKEFRRPHYAVFFSLLLSSFVRVRIVHGSLPLEHPRYVFFRWRPSSVPLKPNALVVFCK
jgi:hypothetical protein